MTPFFFGIMDKIQVVQRAPMERDPKTGFGRRFVFDTNADQIVEISIPGGFSGGWHHHGKRTMYGYVVSGKATMEYGNKGIERAVLSAGDFFLIPPGLVHRDVNPHKEDAQILIFNIGQGPTTLEVSGPEEA
jgi:quercetin dioxygenase-like cupin family protein